MFIKMSGFTTVEPQYEAYLTGLYDGKNVKFSINALLKLINQNIVSGLKGTATTTTVPSNPVNGDYYITLGAGTYTNFKDSTNTAIVVSSTDNFAYLVYNGTYWTKVASTLSVTGYVTTSSIVDNLTSSSTTVPLSANQGRILLSLMPVVGTQTGKNMYNSAAITTGSYISYTNGALLPNATSAISDYIPVTAGQSYTISGRVTSSGARGVSYYDSSKTLINIASGATTWGDGALNGTYVAVTGAAYMRITVRFSGTGDPTVVQVEKGTVATTYEAYYLTATKIGGYDMAPKYIYTDTYGTQTLPAYMTSAGFSSVVVAEKPATINLFNRANIVSGFHINYTNGALAATSGSQTTGLIPCKPSTTYTISGRVSSSGTRGVAYYDSAGTLINTPTGATTWGDGALNGQYTTTAATYFIRFTIAFSTTASSGVEQIEEGSVATSYVAYAGYNAITTVNGNAVLPFDDATIAKVKILISKYQKWYGKKICWMGTSIPANYPGTDKTVSYPNIAANYVNATMINEALASSLVRIATSAGAALATNFQQVCFGMTAAELTAAQGSTYAPNSYETKMLGHLDADLYVFDFGYNDYSVDSTNFATLPSNPLDRNYFIGSMNYVITKLLEQKPKAKFAIFGHYENTSRAPIAAAQQVIADYWKCPIYPTWLYTNWSTKTFTDAATSTTGTVISRWLTDGIHPGSDTTGAATKHIASLATGFLNSIV